MISYKQHELQTTLHPTRGVILQGDTRRVVVIIACSQPFEMRLYSGDGLLFEKMFLLDNTTPSNVLLFRDYGTLIQGEIFASFQSAPVDFTVTEILDSNFVNY